MKKILFCFAITVMSFGLSYGQPEYDSCIFRVSKRQLINKLHRGSEHWIKDSLANNGFRRFFGEELLRCNGDSLIGTNWNLIANFLGKPHFILKGSKSYLYSKDEIWYRYVLFTYGDFRNFKDLGNILLDIIVIDDVIKSVFVQENDG